MISKELLSEVLKLKVCEIVSITLEKNTDFMRLDYECIKILIDEGLANKQGLVKGYSVRYINIYELAHKCKEWAKLKYFIDIDSHSGCARWGAEAVSHNGRPSVFYEQVFIGRTEPEAIFKACEWIMEQAK